MERIGFKEVMKRKGDERIRKGSLRNAIVE